MSESEEMHTAFTSTSSLTPSPDLLRRNEASSVTVWAQYLSTSQQPMNICPGTVMMSGWRPTDSSTDAISTLESAQVPTFSFRRSGARRMRCPVRSKLAGGAE